jgi:type I restriction-modification system DNA methylase subunit
MPRPCCLPRSAENKPDGNWRQPAPSGLNSMSCTPAPSATSIGRGGVVIKNTFLSNTDNASVSLRKQLVESCNLHTVLDCPGGTFQQSSHPWSN